MTELVWGGFIVLFLALLFLDLAVLHRESEELSVPQALFWTAVWICVAACFSFVIYGLYEHQWFGFMPDDDGPRRGAPPTGSAQFLGLAVQYRQVEEQQRQEQHDEPAPDELGHRPLLPSGRWRITAFRRPRPSRAAPAAGRARRA